jgi:hypothetical protein
MPGKLRLRWTGPYWIVKADNGTYQLGTLYGEVLPQWANGFRLKPYYGKMPANPFRAAEMPRQTSSGAVFPTGTRN